MNSQKKTWIAVSCLVLSVVTVTAQINTAAEAVVATTAGSAGPAAAERPTLSDARPTIAPASGRVIVVSLEDRRLALMQDGVVEKVYQVAVGRRTSPSPTGNFTIVDRVENPTYFHPGEVIPPGPDNPVGTRWIGLDRKGYGIHGTNEPHSIGKAASHGCIRMRRRDLEELFADVRSGDSVEIIGERNDETAAIFGQPAAPGEAPSAAAVVAMQVAPEAPLQGVPAEAATGIVPAAMPVDR